MRVHAGERGWGGGVGGGERERARETVRVQTGDGDVREERERRRREVHVGAERDRDHLVWGSGFRGFGATSHQPPEVNYVEVLEEVDLPCRVQF